MDHPRLLRSLTSHSLPALAAVESYPALRDAYIFLPSRLIRLHVDLDRLPLPMSISMSPLNQELGEVKSAKMGERALYDTRLSHYSVLLMRHHPSFQSSY